jgi:uncharacterized membrane protein YcaP (DUF421 family)
MEILVYIIRCIMMLIVTWTGIRIIGKKSLAETTSYDLAAILVLANIAAEPLVYKVTSKATLGIITVVITTAIIGLLSLNKFLYNLDTNPILLIADGKIIKKNLKKIRMNIPLLMSELRIKGYQNISDVEFAIVEPNGKLSVIPKSTARPIQPTDLAIATSPTQLSFPLIIDGQLNKKNWSYLNKDESWLKQQLQAFGIEKIEDVLLAQIDSTGQIHIYPQKKEIKIPEIV